MHVSTDPRLILSLDGLAISFSMLETIYGELQPACDRIRSDNEKLAEALLYSWFFIDIVHRIRRIAESLPGLSKNAEARIFLDATSVAERFRHYVQHLDKELKKIPRNTFPVWGSLSWVDLEDKTLSYAVPAGSNVGQRDTHFTTYNIKTGEWVSNVSLNACDSTFNFDPIFAACSRFRDFIIPWICNTYKGKVNFPRELPIHILQAIPIE